MCFSHTHHCFLLYQASSLHMKQLTISYIPQKLQKSICKQSSQILDELGCYDKVTVIYTVWSVAWPYFSYFPWSLSPKNVENVSQHANDWIFCRLCPPKRQQRRIILDIFLQVCCRRMLRWPTCHHKAKKKIACYYNVSLSTCVILKNCTHILLTKVSRKIPA